MSPVVSLPEKVSSRVGKGENQSPSNHSASDKKMKARPGESLMLKSIESERTDFSSN